MNIKCPSCHFERNVPDANLRPGKTYKVTCPRCSSIFHFSVPEPEFIIEVEPDAEPAESVQASAPAVAVALAVPESEKPVAPATPSAPAEEAKPAPEAQAKAAEPEGDDTLPPGAAIPEFARKEEKPEQEAAPAENSEQPGERASGTWDSWNEQRQAEDSPAEDQPRRGDGRPDGAPWESPEYYGFVGSFTRTLLGVLFHAPDFFRHVKCQFSVIRPILFYVLLSVFQVLCARLWSIKALRELSATATDPQTLAMAEQLMQSMNMPLMLLITPFFSILQAMFLAGIYHLMIRMVQPDRADFATTLRVVCYSAAPLILCLVPMFGSFLATVWSVACVFIGCRYALRLSWLRTILALLPLYILEMAVISQIPALMGV